VFSAACDLPVDADIRAAVERAAKALQKIGVPVDEVKPPIDDGPAIWWEYAMADGSKLLIELFGNVETLRDRMKQMLATPPGEKSAAEFFRIAFRRDAWRAELAEFMEKYPIIIGPPFCSSAFKHGALEVDIDGTSQSLYRANWPVLWANCDWASGSGRPGGTRSP
jgi:Asp-tRNA(Asn)/Glu-tRNA(Gln) amidotransferase A subunit family amidase